MFSCTTGSSQIKLENAYGTQLDISWFTVVSTVISIAAILSGATWTLEPIEKQTYSWIKTVAFLPLFLFRMSAWMIVIIFLDSFTVFVMGGTLLLNMLILFGSQDRIQVDPLQQSFMSFVFPVAKLPSTQMNDHFYLKLLNSLALGGNLYLNSVLLVLFSLYYNRMIDPWASSVKLQIPSHKLPNIFFAVNVLFIAATVPFVNTATHPSMR